MDIVGAHLRARERDRSRSDPLRSLHEALARPVHAAYAWLGSAAPAVHLQVLVLSVGAFSSLASLRYGAALSGLAILWAGHVLQRAARRLDRQRGEPWAVLLEAAAGRGVDLGLVASLAWIGASGLAAAPAWLPGDAFAQPAAAYGWLGAVTAGVMLLRAHLRTHADLQALRAHLLQARRVPGPTVLAVGRPHPAWTWGRERSLLLALLLVACGQVTVALLALLVVHASGCLVTLAGARSRLANAEAQASLALGRGYDEGFP